MASSLTLPDSRTLAYALDSSPKEGPLIILSNSLTAPLSVWDHVVKVLNNNGYRTLRYDQPGHGGSSAPKDLSPTFDSMAEDVHHLLEKLEINKVYSWIGVSMGASAGVYFTTKYPNVVSKLAICDTISSSPINAGTEDTFGPRVAAAREAGNLDSTIQSTLERWFGKEWLENSPQETQRMRTVMSGTTIDGFEACCNALRSETFDLRPRFAKIGSSVDDAICIVGEKDANLPETMKEMRDKIQEGFEAAGKSNKIELVIIKNAGHVSFVDGFEQFTAEVLKWLEA
ncbi:hypothetical protein H9Q69_013892 [Fusarium xylarioides]|uniref:AB hydrolase-1 domain-containing protein n=1 Tax=Fusarium xylarioides TaxID=221167 RepID=A0A9P7L6E2_9HYPO|nr:hypothetical protein H9Q72_006607 [Fusarium xylarioides]KAG5787032.1 hypothetical protein H9Q69_013892 [Fusarium xylarioides]